MKPTKLRKTTKQEHELHTCDVIREHPYMCDRPATWRGPKGYYCGLHKPGRKMPAKKYPDDCLKVHGIIVKRVWHLTSITKKVLARLQKCGAASVRLDEGYMSYKTKEQLREIMNSAGMTYTEKTPYHVMVLNDNKTEVNIQKLL